MDNIQSELFDRIFYYSQNELGYDTYDALPRDGTKYPFVEVAGTDLTFSDLKNAYSGSITQTVNVWGDQDMRFLVVKMMNSLTINKVNSDNYSFELQGSNQTILPDSSVPNTKLFHGILTLNFSYTKGK